MDDDDDGGEAEAERATRGKSLHLSNEKVGGGDGG